MSKITHLGTKLALKEARSIIHAEAKPHQDNN